MSDTAASPIHLDLPRALEMIGDEPDVRDILSMAEQGLRRDLPLMRQLLQAGNVAELQQVLHVIKGMLPVFCSDALADQVRCLEQLSKTAGAEEVAPGFADVEQGLGQLADEIAMYLNPQGRAIQ